MSFFWTLTRLYTLLANPFFQFRNYSILNLSCPFHESSNEKRFLKVTLKNQTGDYLIKSCPNRIPKTLFLFYFSLYWSFSKPVFHLSLRPSDIFKFFCKQKTVPLMVIFQTENIIKLHTSHWCLNFALK